MAFITLLDQRGEQAALKKDEWAIRISFGKEKYSLFASDMRTVFFRV